MKLSDDLLVLELTTDFGTGPTVLHPVLILDSQAGHTLVDTGMPDMEGAIEAALAEVGVTLKDIRQVIITHHDLDHIGSLEAVVKASGTQVWASARETSFIQGEEWPGKMPPQEQVAALLADPQTPPRMRAMLEKPRPARRRGATPGRGRAGDPDARPHSRSPEPVSGAHENADHRRRAGV
ncbi:MBL fold metallo-hydrolase [Deinococcus frigens]|uniref:MBL fold metallo-hydrolase n=1 Tax=Deinococcus frigens TaxID=249403 RepID=UPI000497D408|nr:MBL fold metallo-hydrolase [Deinococcus frigens]